MGNYSPELSRVRLSVFIPYICTFYSFQNEQSIRIGSLRNREFNERYNGGY